MRYLQFVAEAVEWLYPNTPILRTSPAFSWSRRDVFEPYSLPAPLRPFPAAALAAALSLPGLPALAQSAPGVGKINHVVIIMQENRTFDNYFGTYPGADGIPPGVCVPIDPTNPAGGCVKPFHDPLDSNAGGPHESLNAQLDLDDGITQAKQDGYIAQQLSGVTGGHPFQYIMQGVLRHDVMGYHTDEEIPNYWEYARNFVLQDHLFEGVRSPSFPSHLDLTAEWVAQCPDPTDAESCVTVPDLAAISGLQLPYASLFQFFDAHHVSWKYYLAKGYEPDCEDDKMTCAPVVQDPKVASAWNPPRFFTYVMGRGHHYADTHVVETDKFLEDIKEHRLPQVSWLIPNAEVGEHGPHSITTGVMYVTSLVNAVMTSRYWNDTAIFITWDDWGGFYDHVVPPIADTNTSITPVEGFGLRVPGLMISAYAKPGYIDHGVLSFDSYATFIEDLFMDGARLDPAALGVPDHRPDIRDSLKTVHYIDGTKAKVANLMDEFDFSRAPLPPLVLTTHIPGGIAASCNQQDNLVCALPQVTVTWNAVTEPGQGPFTFGLRRDGQWLKSCDPSATTCIDTPGSGTHYYRVFSIDPNGVRSPSSAAALAIEP